jgi:hypothetical protein
MPQHALSAQPTSQWRVQWLFIEEEMAAFAQYPMTFSDYRNRVVEVVQAAVNKNEAERVR